MTRISQASSGRWKIERRQGDTDSQTRIIEALERQVNDGLRLPPSDDALTRMLNAARRDDGMPSEPQIRRLQVLAKNCALTRPERLDLTHVLLGREVRSWNELTAGEAQRLSDAMEGFAYIAFLQAEQGRRWRYGACPAQPCPMRSPEAAAAQLTGG